jgi:hypothetical protein
MRLTKDDIKKLPSRMRVQIEQAQMSIINSSKNSCTQPSKIKNKNFCEYPNNSPSVILFRAINKRFGSALYNKGDAAHEVLIDGSPTQWRYDHLIVSKRLFIEFNGFQHHSKLAAFKRDHRKRAFAQTLGFQIFDITNEMVRENINDVMNNLERILKHRQSYNDVIKRHGKCYSKVFLRA